MLCYKCKLDLDTQIPRGASVCFVCNPNPPDMTDKDYFCEACWEKKHKKCAAFIPTILSPEEAAELEQFRRAKKAKTKAKTDE